MALGDPSTVRLDQLTIVDVEDDQLHPVDPELKEAQARLAAALVRAGARRRRMRWAALRRSFDIWSSTLAVADGQSFGMLLGNGRRSRSVLELLRWAVRRSPHTLPAIGLALLERINDWTPGRVARYVKLGQTLRAEMVDAIGDGIMLYPSYVSPAPRHYAPLFRPFSFVYTAIVNVMQLPATQVPLGLGRRGLPLGVQVVAGPARDHVSVAVAQFVERELGGWIPPPGRVVR
jgi:fatty acid amide hydrolase 2